MSSNAPGSPEPEYLGPEQPAAATSGGSGGSGKKIGVIAVAAVAVFAAVAAAAYAAVSFLGAGPAPATAVPANALGYVSVDVDPSGAQKIEALQMLRKFPAIREELDLEAEDDLRRWVVDQIKEDADCADLDYDDDVAPWIGKKLGVAAMPGEADGEPVPLVVVQVTDEDAALDGVDAFKACESDTEAEGPGVAFSGDYMLMAETQEQADEMAAAATDGSLEDDETYQRWMDELGDPGIITMYAAPDAAQAMLDMETDAMLGSEMPEEDASRLESLAEDFKGAAGVIRFNDGGVEAAFASEGLDELGVQMADEPTDAGALPVETAAAFAVSLPEDWADKVYTALQDSIGPDEVEQAELEIEAETGLAIPEDLEALMGDGFSFAVSSSADLSGMDDGSVDPSTVPVGLRISGDPAEISPVLDKIRTAIGEDGETLVSVEGDGVVAVGLSQDYVEELAGEGDLGDQAQFESAIPDADQASSLFYVDFDAGDWLEKLVDGIGATGSSATDYADSAEGEGAVPDAAPSEVPEPDDGDGMDDSEELKANLAPLSALGISGWAEDEVQHVLFRLTTE